MPRIIPEPEGTGTGTGITLPIDAVDVDVAGPLTNAPSAPTDLETVLSEFDSAFSSLGALTFKGTWNATTNMPALADGVGTSGDYYVVGVGGSTSLDGVTDWVAGDHLIFDGAQSMWIKIDNTDIVSSVFGRTGAVTAASGDYDASQVNFTPSDLTDWSGSADPGQTDDALDQLADRIDTLESSGTPTAPLVFGTGSVAGSTTTRYLYPGYDDDLAQTAAIQVLAPYTGSIKNMRVLQNSPAGNGNSIVYTLRVNSSASLLAVSLASTASSGSDLSDVIAVTAGDTLDIEVTKASSTGAATEDVTVTMEYTI